MEKKIITNFNHSLQGFHEKIMPNIWQDPQKSFTYTVTQSIQAALD